MVVGRSGESQLTDENGQVTAHLIDCPVSYLSHARSRDQTGLRVRRKTTDVERRRIVKRKDKRDQAEKELEAARETGDKDAIEKAAKRTVSSVQGTKPRSYRLVKLLGVPVFEAPCEAEATCAAMCKAGLVHGAATEDMDTLTFACPAFDS